MKRLNKNFSENRKTVEAMINVCGGQGFGCMCDSMIDCACKYEDHVQKQSQYERWLSDYKGGFRKASL